MKIKATFPKKGDEITFEIVYNKVINVHPHTPDNANRYLYRRWPAVLSELSSTKVSLERIE